MRFTTIGSLMAVSAVCCMASMSVLAADAAPESESEGTLQTITVTAQKRAESVQTVPVTVAAISGDTLNQRNVTDLFAVAQTLPNITFRTDSGSAHIAIRGLSFDTIIAEQAEGRVGYHVDGIYISQPANITGTFYDVDRIEVLYGPQGTLFGRNSVGGAVNLITRDPTPTPQGYLQADVGNYSAVNLQGGLGGPITDTVSGRIAFQTAQHSGYGENLTNHVEIDNQNSRNVRGKLKFAPNDDFNAVLSADWSKDDSQTGYDLTGKLLPDVPLMGVALGGRANGLNDRDSYADAIPRTLQEFYGFGIAADWNLHDGYRVVSLTAVRHGQTDYTIDTDQTSFQITGPTIYGETTQQFSEELRLQKDFAHGHWVVGGYFFKETYQEGVYGGLNAQVFAGAPTSFYAAGIWYGGQVNTKAYAGFAQGTYNFTDAFSLVLGARYSSDKKELMNQYQFYDFADAYDPAYFYSCKPPCKNISYAGGPGPQFPGAFGGQLPNQDNTWSNFSPMGTLQYKFDSTKMVYATVSRGFKSGGYNLAAAGGPAYRPETITDYEAGFKGDFLNETLRINAAGFYYDYKDLQVPKIESVAIGALIANAATAKMYGAELQIIAAPTDALSFDLNASAMKSKFVDFPTLDEVTAAIPVNYSGNRLPGVPSYTALFGAQYGINTSVGRFTPRVEASALGDVYFDQSNAPTTRVPGYMRYNAMINFASDDGRYYGSIYGRNLSDATHPAGQITSAGYFGFPFNGSWIPPRTFGIKVGVKF
jgi:iron complex outermembrane receptor protein